MALYDPRRLMRSGRLLVWPLIAFAVALVFSLKDGGRPSWLGEDTSDLQTVALVTDPACNPHLMFCNAAGDGSAALALRLDRDIRPLHPFSVAVRVRGLAADAIERVRVRFAMSGMDMGPNLYALARQSDGTWTGRVTLPVCSTGRVDWLAEASVVAGGVEYRARFPFKTH